MPSEARPGVKGKARDSLAKILEHVLEEECFLLAKTQDYRWSVTGPNLYSLHRLFDEQRRQLDYWLDRVIELTKSIGLLNWGCVKKPAAAPQGATRRVVVPPGSMIGDLLDRHERIARSLRDEIERLRDPATADLLRQLTEFHETTAWMLRVVNNGVETDCSPV